MTVFAPLFSARVWAHAHLLLIGAILAPGQRTVTALLRVLGRSQERHFTNFHRVLNRAQWCPRQGSRLLLALLIRAFVPRDTPLVLGADETIERRGGRKIRHLGCFRDAVRSSQGHVVHCFGLKWVSMMVLTQVGWSPLWWALPFLSVLCPPETPPRRPGQPKRAAPKKRRRTQKQQAYRTAAGHKTSVDWIRQMIKQVHRWQPDRALVLVVDGGLAALGLGWACRRQGTTMVSRLRWDAALYDAPAPSPAGQRGPKPKKGGRQPSPATWAQTADLPWVEEAIDWYGGQQKTMRLFSTTAVWYTPGWEPLPMRWVLVRDPQGQLRDEVFFCTDEDADPVQILHWVIMRWAVEVTFEEARQHLGMETQRQWTDAAIQRTTPIVLGLYSIITWITHHLHQHQPIPVQTAAWYQKDQVTFSDCLFWVRRHLWHEHNCMTSASETNIIQCTPEIFDLLLQFGYQKAA